MLYLQEEDGRGGARVEEEAAVAGPAAREARQRGHEVWRAVGQGEDAGRQRAGGGGLQEGQAHSRQDARKASNNI